MSLESHSPSLNARLPWTDDSRKTQALPFSLTALIPGLERSPAQKRLALNERMKECANAPTFLGN